MKKKYKNACIILGDQLSMENAALAACDKETDVVIMMEVSDETTYVEHHKQKIIFILACMRHFAAALQKQGWDVIYLKLDDKNTKSSFTKTLQALLAKISVNQLNVMHPGEYRVLQAVKSWSKAFGIDVEIHEDNRFFCGIDEFAEWAEGKKQFRMEVFYRHMRKKHGYLLTKDNKPVGGEWNYDSENRKPLKDKIDIPSIYQRKMDDVTQEVIDMVKKQFANHFGDAEPFNYAVTRRQALFLLNKFIEERLAKFGDYQDAMVDGEYQLFHSMLSPYLNVGLLSAKEVCDAATEAYENKQAPLNAVEGFIRQILGWREFIRGIYWLHMPDYAEFNSLNAKRNLPDFYWTAETKMNCLRHAITQTKEIAHSHHIQRLMITGNFALLIGVAPKAICDWYLAVYIDAFDWVELPNTLGMVMHADGGIVGSKPYAASGSYIHKMSNFCQQCEFKVKEKLGKDACPFNYLYWNFLLENQNKLEGNPRLAFAYKHINAMDDETRKNILAQAKDFIKKIGST